MRFFNLGLAPRSLLVAAASAACAHAVVFIPHITAPAANDQWPIESVQTVRWDVSDAPSEISNPEGSIFLREVLTQKLRLLDNGFSILDGAHNVTVPVNVPTGPFNIVLVGSLDNLSPTFSIVESS
ncbi:hypothetical protein NMY22_g15140 [Coprinellus aureogranulatus]|nr:hypothetical protein NMY22_g15140 [Coprinellus aureogranulatus]